MYVRSWGLNMEKKSQIRLTFPMATENKRTMKTFIFLPSMEETAN